MPHRPLLIRLTIALLLVACTCALDGGCSGPSVSGWGIFPNNRNVNVGDIVTIGLPIDASKGEQWRVTSYDSAFLLPVGRPQVTQPGEPGKLTYTLQFEAKLPGTTDVTLTGTSVDSDGQRTTRTETYTVHIYPN